MITVQDAFKKFRSNLELSTSEQTDVSRRHREIRGHMATEFLVQRDFLSGSYKRYTKTKPLKDVDIFCVLADDERAYKKKHPEALLNDVVSRMAPHYGRENLERNRRSVTVNFPRPPTVEDKERVLSFDIVPAFDEGAHFEIPDISTGGWTKTDPEIHEELATRANDAFGGDWKAYVRYIKTWNRHVDKPVRPSFLLEVMALKVLDPPGGGDDRREMKAFFPLP